MNKKTSWAIAGVLALAFYWLIFRNSLYPYDHQFMRALRSAGFFGFVIGATGIPMVILILIFTGPESFFERLWDVLPLFLIIVLTIFIALLLKFTPV